MKSAFYVHIPGIALQPFIQFIWMSEGEESTQRSRVLPNGVVELILNFGDLQKTLHDLSFETKKTFKKFWVAGFQKGPLFIQSVRDTNLVGIRFRPGGAYPFLGFPLHELTNDVEEADWLAPELELLRERLYTLKSKQEVFQRVETYLLEKLGGKVKDPVTAFIAQQIHRVPGELQLADLIDRTGYSHKHVITLFKKNVGVSPVTLLRISRFQGVIQQAKRLDDPKWTEILPYDAFHDAAHFAHDFKKLAGITPDQYLRSRTFDENHCIIR